MRLPPSPSSTDCHSRTGSSMTWAWPDAFRCDSSVLLPEAMLPSMAICNNMSLKQKQTNKVLNSKTKCIHTHTHTHTHTNTHKITPFMFHTKTQTNRARSTALDSAASQAPETFLFGTRGSNSQMNVCMHCRSTRWQSGSSGRSEYDLDFSKNTLSFYFHFFFLHVCENLFFFNTCTSINGKVCEK